MYVGDDMDTLSLYYFSEVAKDLHITRTASRLFISQQTLSNHILRLEEHFGVKLLDRKPNLSLTYAGEYVLKFAQKTNCESANLKDIIADIQQEHIGIILFGASNLRMVTLMPDILPVFSARHPHVEIRLSDGYSKQLEELVLRGELDMALIIPQGNIPKIKESPLMSDQIYLCVSDSLLEKYYSDNTKEIKEKAKQGVNLNDFSKLPFCILKNRIGNKINKCFDEAGFSPRIYTTCTNLQISEFIGFTGLAAAFATRTSLHNLRGAIPKDMNIFPLHYNNKPLAEITCIIQHEERYLRRYNLYFYELVLSYFQKLDQLSVEQLVTSGLKNYYLEQG